LGDEQCLVHQRVVAVAVAQMKQFLETAQVGEADGPCNNQLALKSRPGLLMSESGQ
jgi:hypothetical protein